MKHADKKDKEAGSSPTLPHLSDFDSDSDDLPSMGVEDEVALDISQPPLPRSISDNVSEPDTIFDGDEVDDAAPHPRELRIAPESEIYMPTVGDVLNERFEILKLVGAGASGTTYLVEDLRLKDRKVLKLMHPALAENIEAAERFIAEIKTLQQLSHENIVRVYDFGKTDGSNLSFFTMEYVRGTSLAALLKKKGGRLPLEKSLALVDQILDALVYAHQHSTSQNLNPNNIMVRPSGKVVLLNFGVTEGRGTTPLAHRNTLGRCHYQAPEQRLDPTVSTPQSDLYAVGALLYQLLTGEVPLGQAKRPSHVNHTLPRRLDPVIMRCLESRPENRFKNATETHAALQKAMNSPRWLGLLIIATLFLLGGLIVGWFLS